MAETSGQQAGKMGYEFWKRESALADDGTLVIAHSTDSVRKRIVTVIDMSTGAFLPVGPDGAGNVGVVCTDDNTTTVTNLTGAAADILVSVFIPS